MPESIGVPPPLVQDKAIWMPSFENRLVTMKGFSQTSMEHRETLAQPSIKAGYQLTSVGIICEVARVGYKNLERVHKSNWKIQKSVFCWRLGDSPCLKPNLWEKWGQPAVHLAVPMTSDLVPVKIPGQTAKISWTSPFLGWSSKSRL